MQPGPLKSLAALLACAMLLVTPAVWADAQRLPYKVLQVQPKAQAFTQGLEAYQGDWLHSSGLVGKSYVERLSAPGKSPQQTLWQHKLDAPYFAEGLSVFNDQLYLLSWRQQKGWILNPENGEPIEEIHYKGEGWGLTNNGVQLIRSDGSNTLYFHQPESFALSHTLAVHWNGRALRHLNELEYAQGLIWANIWHSAYIVAISPHNGQVVGYLDLSKLVVREAPEHRENVLNGIAYDKSTQSFWLTGKRWEHWYQISIEEPLPAVLPHTQPQTVNSNNP